MSRIIPEHVIVGDIATNCWIYPLPEPAIGGSRALMNPCVLIDPGDEAELIISRLKSLNLFPQFILLSHGHFDHLAALPDILNAFKEEPFSSYPLPKIGIHKLDSIYLGKNSLKYHHESIRAAGGSPTYIDVLWNNPEGLPDADFLLEEGSMTGTLRTLHISGHSRGSIAFYDEKEKILFSGDTLFKNGWGRTDLPGGDEEQIIQSLKRLLAMDGDILICPGHGETSIINKEREFFKL